MAQQLNLAHFGLRTRDMDRSIAWYAKVLDAKVHYRNELVAFMSFDDEHHRFVLWDDGETEEKPANAGGVDHIAFGCSGPGDLADQYERLKGLGVIPALSVNHHFTSSLYYRDPDGNEVEFTCDNFPTKAACVAFMATTQMAEAMQPPLFGSEFDPEALLGLRRIGAAEDRMARIGL